MTDGIIKGTGNSRYMRGPANAATLYPDFESFRDAWAAGTLPFDLNGINPAGWETVGDKLGKSTLLTDALCTALSLSTTATPTQAIDKLRQLVNTAQNTASGKCQIITGSYKGLGRLTGNASTPTSVTAPFPVKILWIPFKYYNGRFYCYDHFGTTMVSNTLSAEFKNYVGMSYSDDRDKAAGKISPDGKTFYWYYTSSGFGANPYDDTNDTYYYVAIG